MYVILLCIAFGHCDNNSTHTHSNTRSQSHSMARFRDGSFLVFSYGVKPMLLYTRENAAGRLQFNSARNTFTRLHFTAHNLFLRYNYWNYIYHWLWSQDSLRIPGHGLNFAKKKKKKIDRMGKAWNRTHIRTVHTVCWVVCSNRNDRTANKCDKTSIVYCDQSHAQNR